MVESVLYKTGVAFGLGATAFLGYCIYFDYKRRTAPGYRQMIREKRRAQEKAVAGGSPRRGPMTPNDMQQFFVKEMEKGEQLLAMGLEQAAEHFANSAVISGQQQQVLALLQTLLPPDVFASVLGELPAAQVRMARLLAGVSDVGAPIIEEVDEDIEKVAETIEETDEDEETDDVYDTAGRWLHRKPPVAEMIEDELE